MSRLAGSSAGRWSAAACTCFAVGSGAGFASGASVPMATVVGLVLGLLACTVLTRRAAPGAAIVAVLLAGSLLGLARGQAAVERPGPQRISGHLRMGPVAVTGTVRSSSPGGGDFVIVDAARLATSESDGRVIGGILVTGSTLPAVAPGDEVEVDAAGLRAASRRPGAESEATLERQDVEAVAVAPLMSVSRHGGVSLPRLVAAAQSALVAAVERVLPEPAAALTLGIAFGIHRPMAADVRAPLQAAGLIHVVAVSGLKVVMILGLARAVARLAHWSPRRTIVVALGVAGAYVLLSGAGPAAVRSLVMAGVALLTRSGGRRADPLPLLALVAAAMLAVDPRLVLDPGFQLSFLGTAGILLLAEPIARRLAGPRLLAEPFAVTVAAQAATVPVMAGSFGVIALVGPVANALALPALPALIVLGGAGGVLGLVHQALGWLPLQLAGLGSDLVILLSRVLTMLPGSWFAIGGWPVAWSVGEAVGLAVLGTVLARWRHRPPPTRHAEAADAHLACGGGRGRLAAAASAALAAAVIASLVVSRPDGRLRAAVLDTGSSTAVALITPDGSVALVDGGSSPSLLQQALGRVLPPLTRKLNLVVATGGEPAAVAGRAGLPGHYEVGTVIAGASLTAGATTLVEQLRASGANVLRADGQTWVWGKATWRCFPFVSGASGSSRCALRVSDGRSSILVLGDAAAVDQEELAGLYGSALHADVVVTPPGGALSPVLLSLVQPRTVVVPVAKGAHAAVAPMGVQIAHTGADGDVTLSASGGGSLGLS